MPVHEEQRPLTLDPTLTDRSLYSLPWNSEKRRLRRTQFSPYTFLSLKFYNSITASRSITSSILVLSGIFLFFLFYCCLCWICLLPSVPHCIEQTSMPNWCRDGIKPPKLCVLFQSTLRYDSNEYSAKKRCSLPPSKTSRSNPAANSRKRKMDDRSSKDEATAGSTLTRYVSNAEFWILYPTIESNPPIIPPSLFPCFVPPNLILVQTSPPPPFPQSTYTLWFPFKFNIFSQTLIIDPVKFISF